MESPGTMSDSDNVILQDAVKIVEEAEKRKITLRLLGALAVKIHSEKCGDLYRKLKRLGEEKPAFTDIDLIAYSKERVKVRTLLENIFGFNCPGNFMLMHGKERLLYFHPKRTYHLDVFFDKLQFSHDLHFGSDPNKGRLKLDYPTIPLSDLFLEKLQIHEINEKDIKDIIVLLMAHDIALTDQRETINAKYVAEILADDWGFWYDVKMNLAKVKLFAEKYFREDILASDDFKDICQKIDCINNVIDAEPKTKKWKKREKEGTSKIWWRPVEEMVR